MKFFAWTLAALQPSMGWQSAMALQPALSLHSSAARLVRPVPAVSRNLPGSCLGSSRYMSKKKRAGSRMVASAEVEAPVKYDPAFVEPKWQAYWDEQNTFLTRRRPGKEKKYVLDMFPYPSGAGLHVGHPEGYTASDIMARYWRMNDYDVLHPMGWDSFGLPAEQHAINTGTHPEVTTFENIANFKRQLKMLGFSYDWDRELATTDIEYVKWTQWIFLQLFKSGLAKQSEVSVNWCPKLGTVLANEEVIDGKSERGDFPVVRLPLRQWVLKITEYADKLLSDLDGLEWPESTMTMQKQWIGRSQGAEIKFQVADAEDKSLTVFTTRPDTLMGVTYVTLAPENALVAEITTAEQKEAVEAYLEATKSKSDMDRTAGKDKTGVATGAFAVHPLTGEQVPIWISDYVLAGYGTGAVMAVPAHDDRDFEFAKEFGLGVVEVVSPDGKRSGEPLEAAFTAPGTNVNSGDFDGLKTGECKQAVIDALVEKGAGSAKTTYKLRDWIFSRQRYWGEPIPIYFPVEMGEEGGDPREGAEHTILYDEPIPVEETDLPVELPELENFQPGDDPQGCLARATDWRYFQKDGQWYARETNTMPQWAGSCWYYLRFTDPKNSEQGWSTQAMEDWMPVDLYVGGAEHAVLHLLYARFWHKVLYDMGVVKHKEPFQELVHQGMILGTDGEKMSKSRGNVINPDDIVQQHGSDALRLYEMFMGPLEAVKPWNTAQVQGVVRFRDRIATLTTKPRGGDMDAQTEKLMHQTLKKVTLDYDDMAFNTAISAMMIFSSHLQGLETIPTQALENLVLMVSPIAPHLGEECWERLGHTGGIAYVPWPKYDEALCVENTVKIGVQVNGKARGAIEIAKDASQEEAQAAAMQIDKVVMFVEGKEMKKVIYVPGKILNLVVGK